MKLVPILVAVALLVSTGNAIATERTVTLGVERMTCVTCPITVKKALSHVPGVKAVKVSLLHKQAVVTFDDVLTDVGALTRATTNAGYPSRPVE
ncbi:MAG: mercury resistance system periplasmic binding protein MerP [Nitrospirae bacterium]|nr:mercury resistance system periplasmic binding protein MerP [Nitrospirota bacterium]